jgi:phosphate acetyltransferase
MSHAFAMALPNYPHEVLVTDAVVNIYPTLDEKRDIVQNAIDLARALGISTPKVAILSAVETVSAKIASTVDAAALCKMADRGQISGGVLDGPLALDDAIDEGSALEKGIRSEVAGHADVLVVPDLESGNILAKGLILLARADSAGIVLGARVPVILTSRADSTSNRVASAAMALLYARWRSLA